MHVSLDVELPAVGSLHWFLELPGRYVVLVTVAFLLRNHLEQVARIGIQVLVDSLVVLQGLTALLRALFEGSWAVQLVGAESPVSLEHLG